MSVRQRTDVGRLAFYNESSDPREKQAMDDDRNFIRLPYQGWEVRSHLTQLSFDGTVAAGAMLYFEEACKCHLMSSKQFAKGNDAIRAIEVKATQWIDERATTDKASHDKPALLS